MSLSQGRNLPKHTPEKSDVLKEQDQKWLILGWLHQITVRICKEETEHQIGQQRMDPIIIEVLLENIAIIYHHLELDQCKEVKGSNLNRMEQAELQKVTELDNKVAGHLSEDN